MSDLKYSDLENRKFEVVFLTDRCFHRKKKLIKWKTLSRKYTFFYKKLVYKKLVLRWPKF